MGSYATGEITLAKEVVPQLKPGMLCLADRLFFGFTLWTKAQASGCDLLWRVRKHLRLEVHERLSDGSYLSAIYLSQKDARHKTKGVRVRVIDYQLQGIPDAEPIYRLVTTIHDPLRAPAEELAALYHERWEIENTFDELKTHLRGRQIVLRSKTPELVRQEFYGFLLAHFAVSYRSGTLFPPRARKNLHHTILDEILEERVVSSRKRWNPRGVKRKMSKYPLRPRHQVPASVSASQNAFTSLSEQYWG